MRAFDSSYDEPVIDDTEPHHLQQAADALTVHLSDEEAAALEEPYTNAGPSWY